MRAEAHVIYLHVTHTYTSRNTTRPADQGHEPAHAQHLRHRQGRRPVHPGLLHLGQPGDHQEHRRHRPRARREQLLYLCGHEGGGAEAARRGGQRAAHHEPEPAGQDGGMIEWLRLFWLGVVTVCVVWGFGDGVVGEMGKNEEQEEMR